MARVSGATRSDEWYTPPVYIEAARAVLGTIDLDPASCDAANATVKAARFYTKAQDGLVQPWQGRVWLNPPYGKLAQAFVAKLVVEHECGRVPAAIALLNSNSTDPPWFQPLWDYLLCFTRGRIRFISGDGHAKFRPQNGSVFVYLGPRPQNFIKEFDRFGEVVRRAGEPRLPAVAAPERHRRPTPSFAATDNGGPLLDYETAAAYLAVSERHVRELWAKRRLAGIKVGRSVRFLEADLDAFIVSNRVSAVR